MDFNVRIIFQPDHPTTPSKPNINYDAILNQRWVEAKMYRMQGGLVWERARDMRKTRYIQKARRYQVVINYMHYLVTICTVFIMVMSELTPTGQPAQPAEPVQHGEN